MAKRTTASAHDRMDEMKVEVAEIKTEIKIAKKTPRVLIKALIKIDIKSIYYRKNKKILFFF